MLDFDAAWAELHGLRAQPACSAHWDKKAPRFDNKDAKNLYACDFLDLAQVKTGETVFDMGCGTGALAVPLAREGHGVIAADFSSGMLDKMAQNMAQHGIAPLELSAFESVQEREGSASAQAAEVPVPAGIAALKMSWEDAWESHGLHDNMVDVALASRSIAVEDLRAALSKLTRIAKRACCVTMATACSPRVDSQILRTIGVEAGLTRDYLYAFGMLVQAGFEPSVSFIHSKRKDTFNSLEDAREDFGRMIELGAPDLAPEESRAAYENLAAWLDAHVVENPEAGKPDKKGLPQGRLTLDFERVISWAFISWDARVNYFDEERQS